MDQRTDSSGLESEFYPMPADVTAALRQRGLVDLYARRPAYQQNDYIGWIVRAKRPETRLKRVAQMLDELHQGGVYMRMKWSGDSRT